MKQTPLEIGPLEMQVLGAVNSSHRQSVHDIQAALKHSGKDLAYTTVMTVLVRLYNKDLLIREKEGRQYLYSPAKKKDSSAVGILEKVRRSLFQSERLKPILSLLDSSDDNLTRQELEELKKAVEAKLRNKEFKA